MATRSVVDEAAISERAFSSDLRVATCQGQTVAWPLAFPPA